MKIQFLKLCCFLLFINSCAKTKNTRPIWYLNPPEKSEKYVVSVGEESFPKSLVVALSDLSRQQNTSVKNITKVIFDTTATPVDSLWEFHTFTSSLHNYDMVQANSVRRQWSKDIDPKFGMFVDEYVSACNLSYSSPTNPFANAELWYFDVQVGMHSDTVFSATLDSKVLGIPVRQRLRYLFPDNETCLDTAFATILDSIFQGNHLREKIQSLLIKNRTDFNTAVSAILDPQLYDYAVLDSTRLDFNTVDFEFVESNCDLDLLIEALENGGIEIEENEFVNNKHYLLVTYPRPIFQTD